MCECAFCDTCEKIGQIMVGNHGRQNLGTIDDDIASNQSNKLFDIEVLLLQMYLVVTSTF